MLDNEFFRGLNPRPEKNVNPKVLIDLGVQWELAMRAKLYVIQFN